MNNLKLVLPNKTHKKQAVDFIKEMKEKSLEIHGAASLVETYYEKGYDAWLEKNERNKKEETLEKDKVPNKDNLASAKVIQKNGGVLENEVLNPKSKKIRQRYWIKV